MTPVPVQNVQLSPEIRVPRLSDAASIHALIARCPPLDTNSMYCTVLQCTHHAQTCALAEDEDGQLVGFVSSYRLPQAPENLFVWQVAIDEHTRGRGLARQLIWQILGRPACRGVCYLRTTITADNKPSWAMFQGLAEALQAETNEQKLFDRDKHFNGRHASEHELVIGPFSFSSCISKGIQ